MILAHLSKNIGGYRVQTMTDLSTFNLEISEQQAIPSATGLIKQFEITTEQLEWPGRLFQIEKWANRLCLVIVVLSVLYFTPIVIYILCR
jgi:hypothetical protein